MSVTEWKIYCIDEAMFKTIWGTEAPTTCPTNSAHQVNPNSITEVQTINTRSVIIETETDPDTRTNGHYGVNSWLLDIPAGAMGSTTIQNTTFGYPINMMLVSFRSADNAQGDTFSCDVAPKTIIGICTTTASIGTTTIYVNSTVMANLSPGYLVDIDTGVTTAHLGRCLTMDIPSSSISVEHPVTNSSFSAGSYIRQTIRFADRYILTNSQDRLLGTGKIGCSYVPGKTPMQVVYTNNNGLAKKFHIDMEYMY